MRLTAQQRYYFKKNKAKPYSSLLLWVTAKTTADRASSSLLSNFSCPLFSAQLKEPQLFFSLNVLLCPLWGRTPHSCPTKCGAYPFLQCVGLREAQVPCKGTHSCPSETIDWNHRQLARFRVCPALLACGCHMVGIATCFWCSFPTALWAGVVSFLFIFSVPKTDICT